MQPGIRHIPGNWWRLLPSYQSCPKSVIAILRGKEAVAGRLCHSLRRKVGLGHGRRLASQLEQSFVPQDTVQLCITPRTVLRPTISSS